MNLAARFPPAARPRPRDEENVAARAATTASAAAVAKKRTRTRTRKEARRRRERSRRRWMAPNSERAREGTESEDCPDTPKVAEAKRVGGEALPANASLPSSPQPMPTNVTTAFDSPQIPAASPRAVARHRRAARARTSLSAAVAAAAAGSLPAGASLDEPAGSRGDAAQLFRFDESPPSSPRRAV